MRNFALSAGALFAALLASTSAFAGNSQLKFSCEEFATALADKATGDDMQWAGDFDAAEPGKVLIIGAGRKFYVPAHKNPRDLAPKTVSENLGNYDDAYQEAYWRCYNASNITIQVQK